MLDPSGYACSGAAPSLANDIIPTAIIGSVSGLIAFGSGLGGSLFTYFTGKVVENVSYDAIFVIMGFLHPLSYGIFRLMQRSRFARL